MDESLVTPLDTASPPPETPPEAQDTPQQPAGADFSPELLQIPAIQALMAGSPPALSFNVKQAENTPEAKIVTENKDALMSAGFGFYRSLSGQLGVIFNGLHIHGQDIQAADKAGKLLALAPPFQAINHAIGKSGLHNPVFQANSVPTGLASPRSTAPPQAGAIAAQVLGQSPPASVQNRLATQRNRNLQPGAPTSGPSPGAGRLLNSILKPVV